jgi:multidrug resistance efflux pump
LRRELIEQQRLRDINIAGEKPQRTRAALEELRLAESDLETEERSFERSKQLYEAEVISDEEFEVAENSYRQKKQQVRIAQANYEDVTAGSKKEEIDLVEATIEAVRKEIAKTRERIDALTIETPVSGVFSNSYNPDETGEEVLARVASNRNMVLKAPVEITQKPFLSEGMTVEINGTHPEKEVQGKVLFVHNEVKSLDGRQIVFATCLLPNEDDLLFPNLRIEGVIIGDKINLCEYLYRMLGTIFTS